MTLRTTTRRTAAALLLVAATGTTLASCGDDKPAATTAQNVKVVKGIKVGNATDLSKKPQIDIPDVLPPKTLIKEDIVVGTGPTVKTGDALTAQYVGVAWSGNNQFDASWDRKGAATPFTLSKGSVIDGWTEGLPGMKVGGRRLLIVPPAKGYGAQGQGADIPANETLVFIVDAKKTAKGAPAAAATDGAASSLTPEQLQQLQEQAAQQAGGTATP